MIVSFLTMFYPGLTNYLHHIQGQSSLADTHTHSFQLLNCAVDLENYIRVVCGKTCSHCCNSTDSIVHRQVVHEPSLANRTAVKDEGRTSEYFLRIYVDERTLHELSDPRTVSKRIVRTKACCIIFSPQKRRRRASNY